MMLLIWVGEESWVSESNDAIGSKILSAYGLSIFYCLLRLIDKRKLISSYLKEIL